MMDSASTGTSARCENNARLSAWGEYDGGAPGWAPTVALGVHE